MDSHAADQAIRVALADDHDVVRRGLQALFEHEPDIEIVGQAATADEALVLVRRTLPDVLLLDLLMPGLDTTDVITTSRASCPGTAVVVLTSDPSEGSIIRAQRAGAHTYLVKDVDSPLIVDTIRAAARGTNQPAIVRAGPPAQAAQPQLQRLTPREIDVLLEIADGHNNATIARRLYLSEGTIKTHVNSILTKLGVNDRTQAAVLAWRHGLRSPRSAPSERSP